jgi:GGDEF domain-containing protein
MDAEGDEKKAKKWIEKYLNLAKGPYNKDTLLSALKNIREFSIKEKFNPRIDYEKIACKSLFSYADQALLKAKEKGKNTILVYDFNGFGKYDKNGLWVPIE